MAEAMVIGGHDLRLGHERCCGFLFALSLESFTIGEASYLLWGHSQSTLWRDQGVRN